MHGRHNGAKIKEAEYVSMRQNAVSAIIIAAILGLDIITKHLVVTYLAIYDRLDYLGGFIRISLVYNEGGVFGILQGYKTVFLVISIIVLALMVVFYIREANKTMLFSVSMAMIIAGAIGNIIDRLIPGRPGVVDFISIGDDRFYRWPSFNVADSAIVVGVCLLMLVFWLDERRRRASAGH